MGLTLGDEVAQVRHDMAVEAIAPFEVQVIEGGFDQQQFLRDRLGQPRTW